MSLGLASGVLASGAGPLPIRLAEAPIVMGDMPVSGEITTNIPLSGAVVMDMPVSATLAAAISLTNILNWVPNNTYQGGVAGTPGTMPTAWGQNIPAGLQRQISFGVDAAGRQYMDYRLFGTFSGEAVSVGDLRVGPTGTTTPAGVGETWTASAMMSLVAGAIPTAPGTALSLDQQMRSAAGSGLTGNGVTLAGLTSTPTKKTATTIATNDATAFFDSYLRLVLTPGDPAVDFTIRIADWQVQEGASTVDGVLTYGTAGGRGLGDMPISAALAVSLSMTGAVALTDMPISATMAVAINLTMQGVLENGPWRTNFARFNNDLSNAAWGRGGLVPVVSAEAAPSSPMIAWDLTDDNASAYESLFQSLAVPPNSETYYLTMKVKKTIGATAGVAVNFGLTGGSSVSLNFRLNPNSGQVTGGWTVTDEGDYWGLNGTITNNGTNTSLNLSIYPAATAIVSAAPGSDSATATGTATFAGIMVGPGTMPPPEFLVTGAAPRTMGGPFVTNLLLNSRFSGVVAGTPGTAPTSWPLVANGGSLAVVPGSGDGNALTISATGARQILAQNVLVEANTVTALSAKLNITAGSSALWQFVTATSLPADATLEFTLNDAVVAGSTILSAGQHLIGIRITTAGTAGVPGVRLGVGCQSNVVGTVTATFDAPMFHTGSARYAEYIPTGGSPVSIRAPLTYWSNLIPYWSPTLAQQSARQNASLGTEPLSAPVAGLNWSVYDNSVTSAYGYQTVPVAPNTAYVLSFLVETPDGSPPVATTSTTTGDFVAVVGSQVLLGPTNIYTYLSGNVWRVDVIGTTQGSPTFGAGVIRYAGQNTRALKFSGFNLKRGTDPGPLVPTYGQPATASNQGGLAPYATIAVAISLNGAVVMAPMPVLATLELGRVMTAAIVMDGMPLQATLEIAANRFVKRAGVVFPSYGREAVWTSPDAFVSDYPATNLSLIDKSRFVAVRSAAGTTRIDFVLPASRAIDFVGLIQHNAEAGSFFQIQLSTGTDPTANIVFDSGSVAFWETADIPTGYLSVRPYALHAPTTIRSGRITLTGNTAPWELSAVELGVFWSWYDVAYDREIGVVSKDKVQSVVPGIEHVTAMWSPRFVSGSRKVIDQSEADNQVLDFQRTTGRSKAFVWCWDMLDATTWARESWLARNRSLPPAAAIDYEVGSMNFDFMEHLG